MKNASTLS